MVWSDEQWAFFANVLRRGFASRDPLEQADEDVYRYLLRSVDPGAAMLALETMVQEGQALRPRPGEIAARCSADPSEPTWDEARQAIFGERGVLRRMIGCGSPGLDFELRDEHPLVASYVRTMGAARLANEPVEDPDYGRLRLRDLEQAWDRHVEAREGREVVALARGEGGMAAIAERARAELGEGS